MERPKSCRRIERNTCGGCPVVEIAVERLLSAKSNDRPITILRNLADTHCPEGQGPAGIMLPPNTILSHNGRSQANREVSKE